MPREKEAYRDNLSRILEAFPGREIITITELARWLHLDPRTVKRKFPIKEELGISVASLARFLS